MCKQVGLGYDDLENLTIGTVIDYTDTYIRKQNEQNGSKPKKRKATKEDYAAF